MNMDQSACSLASRKCKPCEGGTQPLSDQGIQEALEEVEGWDFVGGEIERTFSFKNYYETTAFTNAVVWIAHREDHHPNITFGYKTCRIVYSTHAVQGISENDFICAAKINELL